MANYFLLNKDQVIGRKKLSIFKDGSVSDKSTDFAKFKSAESGVIDRCNDWWLNMREGDILATIASIDSKKYLRVNPALQGFGLRPAVNYEDIRPFAEEFFQDKDTIMVNFGEYPQDYVPDNFTDTLNNLLDMGYMKKTNNPNVYWYNDQYYIKDQANNKWISYGKLTWIVDRKTGIAVCDKIIDAGKKSYYETIDFLNNSFGKIIFSNNKIREYNALNDYNRLLSKKKETEGKLSSINSLLNTLEDEIISLRRKKK